MITPESDLGRAFGVTLFPDGNPRKMRNSLFDRGYDRWLDDTDVADIDEFVESIEAFFLYAVDSEFSLDDHRPPLVDDPGVLTILATHAAYIAEDHEAFESVLRRRNQVVQDVISLAGEVIVDQLRVNPDRQLLRTVAEAVYEKEPDPDRPFVGRTCTDVTEDVPFDGADAWVEIPLVAASKQTIATVEETPDLDPDVEDKSLRSNLHDNNVYVPIDDLFRQVPDLWADGFDKHMDHLVDAVPAEQKETMLEHEEEISHRIDRFDRAGHRERLYKNYDPDKDKRRLIVKAVKEARDGAAQLGDELTAKAIHNCLQAYDPTEFEERALNELHNPRSIAQFLSTQTDKDTVEKVVNSREKTYILRPMKGSSKQVPINDLEDIFEFPCFEAMDERLMEKGPTRKELYSLVRLLWWLPQDDPETDRERFIEDVKDLFSRWPWYDEPTTDYQVRYELLQGKIDGEPPLPIGCNNDDMQLYCIGKEQCPYSLYGSVNFPPEVYDKLEENDS